jgi:Flp pilus assembly protein TadG
MPSLFAGQIGRFYRDRRGNVAIVFTLALIPVLTGVGCAIDYSRASQIRSRLQAAIDAASVGSVTKTSPAFVAAGSMSSDGPIPAGVTDAIQIFNGNVSGQTGYTLNGVTATVTETAGNVDSTVQFSANVPTTFLNLIGERTMTVTGTSTSTASMPRYIDFYLLLDNSPSMGVAATPADITQMQALTGGCAFACHDSSIQPPQLSNYDIAKNNGVTT